MPGTVTAGVLTGQPVAVELSESIKTRYCVVAALAITLHKRAKHSASARVVFLMEDSPVIGPGVYRPAILRQFAGTVEKKKVRPERRKAVLRARIPDKPGGGTAGLIHADSSVLAVRRALHLDLRRTYRRRIHARPLRFDTIVDFDVGQRNRRALLLDLRR